MGTRRFRGVTAAAIATLGFLVACSPPMVGVAKAETVPYFSQIDCRAGSTCLGTTLFEVWRTANWGASWAVVLNAPADGIVNGVACSGSTCLAYGGFGSPVAPSGG